MSQVEEIPPAPQDGRKYVWVEEMNSWFDISPKENDTVKFVRIGEKNERINLKDS